MSRKDSAIETIKRLKIEYESIVQHNNVEFSEIMNSFIYGDIYNQGNLSDEIRFLINIVVLVTIQETKLCETEITNSINYGIDPYKIRESIYQCAPFTGYPKTVSALAVLNKVYQNNNIKLKSTKNIPDDNRFQNGKNIQYPIYGDRIIESLKSLPKEQADKIPVFLTENCFGDFYTRPYLSIKERELIILCIFCALGGCEVQIRSHTAGNIKVGNTKEYIVSAVTHCIPLIGFSRVLNALNIIKEIEENLTTAST